MLSKSVLSGGAEAVSDYDESVYLKNDVAELRRRIESIESFIMRLADRIVALERLERDRDEDQRGK